MKTEYELEYLETEKKHPWFVVRRDLSFGFVRKYPRIINLLDFGTGTGIFLNYLKKKGFVNVKGYEPSKAMRSGSKGVKIINKLTVKDKGAYDLVFCLDVLEHIKDEKKAVEELSSLLRPGGRLILSVPAFNFLWSHHDELNLHYRRYDKPMLRKAFRNSGLKIKRLTYWNTIFFPAAWLMKFLRKKSEGSGDAAAIPSWFAPIFRLALRIENFFILSGVNLPFGVSLWAIFEKDGRN